MTPTTNQLPLANERIARRDAEITRQVRERRRQERKERDAAQAEAYFEMLRKNGGRIRWTTMGR